MEKKLVIIGAGPAGLAAAIGAVRGGLMPEDILLLERESELGGVLNQCIHDGFGAYSLSKNLTGTEYAEYFINEFKTLGIEYLTESTVLSISKEKEITFVSTSLGYTKVKANTIILAMGCRERSHGSLRIAGTRPAGVYSAGTVQRFINIDGQLPGKRAVLFGSGDIGLITARRLMLEGAKIVGAYERKAYPRGLDKNVKECLEDFGIELQLNKTITKILGKERVEGVTVADIDESSRPIKGTEKLVKCDTLVLSLGLIPDNIIGMEAGIAIDRATGGAYVNQYFETDLSGVFTCGNALHIHDIVDYITEGAMRTGEYSAAYLLGELPDKTREREISKKGEIKYTVPHKFDFPLCEKCDNTVIYYRVSRVLEKAQISLKADGETICSEQKFNMYPSQMHMLSLNKVALERLASSEEIAVEVTEVAE